MSTEPIQEIAVEFELEHGRPDPGDIDAYFEQQNGSGQAATLEPFAGRTHAEVLELDFGDAPAELIEGLVPLASVITTAGLPETYKGWVCAKKADMIASGAGELFGCKPLVQGPVGYFWQDDSDRAEAERVQLYARVHETPADLDVRWFLNEGLELPRDLERLRATIDHYGFIYAVLDSFYNVAGDTELREREAGLIFAALKRDVCDPTGCTIDVVDHMPWATDTNRKRLRGYGDVFKNAAIRAGLYIDADGKSLYVEVRGNNIRGFKRTPAYWDADALELRLVEAGDHGERVEVKAEEIAILLEAEARTYSTTAIRKAVKGGNETVSEALELLKNRGRVQTLPSSDPAGSGKSGHSRGWYATTHAASLTTETLPLDLAATPGNPAAEAEPCHPAALPLGRQGAVRQGSDHPETASLDQHEATA